MNGCYIRNLSAEKFHEMAMPYYDKLEGKGYNLKMLSSVLQPRIEVLNDIRTQTEFLAELPEYDVALFENKKMKTNPEIAKKSLELVLPVLKNALTWSNEALFEALKEVASNNELKNGQVLYPLRIALSGLETTPGGATELAVVLGKTETLARVKKALQKL